MISTKHQIEKYLLSAINMALSINGETSYNNSFTIKVLEDGFLFIPRMPTSFLIDDDLYQRIYTITNVALYPRYTLLKQNAAYIVALDSNDIHTERALFFPWLTGIAQRLKIEDLNNFLTNCPKNQIPVMKNLSINLDTLTSCLISGASGSGKSMFLEYILNVLKPKSDLVVIDYKLDSPSRWAKRNNIRFLAPLEKRSKSEFLSQVNDVLSEALNLIHERQRILFNDEQSTFIPFIIAIDEVLALSTDVNKQIKDSFFSLLSQIALLGRSTKVHLLVTSQRFDNIAYPIAAREQANVVIQCGEVNSKTVQFLFPDLDPSGIVLPSEIGSGLIQIQDNRQTSNVLPLLTPTYSKKGGQIK